MNRSGNKQAREGWLQVDDRASGGQNQEFRTQTCNHCHAVVIMNPERIRPRGFCRRCDSYLCDACEAARQVTLTCRTMDEITDDYLTAVEKQTQPAVALLLPNR